MIGKLEFFTKAGPVYNSRVANELFKRKWGEGDLPIYIDKPINYGELRDTNKLVNSIEEGFERVIVTLNDAVTKMKIFANFDNYLQVHPRMKSGTHIPSKSHKENTKDHNVLRNYVEEMGGKDRSKYEAKYQEINLTLEFLDIWDKNVESIENEVSDFVNDRTDDRHTEYYELEDQDLIDIRQIVRNVYMTQNKEEEMNLSPLISQLVYYSSDDIEKIQKLLEEEKVYLSSLIEGKKEEANKIYEDYESINNYGNLKPEVRAFDLSDKLHNAIDSGEFDEEIMSNIESIFNSKEKFLLYDEHGVGINVNKHPSFTYGMLEEKGDYSYNKLRARPPTERIDGSDKIINDIIDSLVKNISNSKTIRRLISLYIKNVKKPTSLVVNKFQKLLNECFPLSKIFDTYIFIFDKVLRDVPFVNKTKVKEQFTAFYNKLEYSNKLLNQELTNIQIDLDKISRTAN